MANQITITDYRTWNRYEQSVGGAWSYDPGVYVRLLDSEGKILKQKFVHAKQTWRDDVKNKIGQRGAFVFSPPEQSEIDAAIAEIGE